MSHMSETELIYAIRGIHFLSSQLKSLLIDNEPIEPEILEKIKSNEKIVRDLEVNLPLFFSWGQRARQWRIDFFWYKERVSKVKELIEEKKLEIAERVVGQDDTRPIRDGLDRLVEKDDSGCTVDTDKGEGIREKKKDAQKLSNTEAEDVEEDEVHIKENAVYRILRWNRLITAAEKANEMSNQTQKEDDPEKLKDSNSNAQKTRKISVPYFEDHVVIGEKTGTVSQPKIRIINIPKDGTDLAKDTKEKKKRDLLNKLDCFKERMPSGEAVGHIKDVKKILQDLKDAGMDMADSALKTKVRRIFTDHFLAETSGELTADEYVEMYYHNHNKSFEDIRNYTITSVLKRIQSYKPVAGGSGSLSPEPFNSQASFISSGSPFQSSRFDDSNYRCFYCDGSHRAVHCTKFFKRSERVTRVRELGLCELCLLPKCNLRFCRAQSGCSVCGARHHRSLCPVYLRH